MIKKKRFKVIGIIIMMLIMVTIFIIRVRYVNAQYPMINCQQYEIGQNFDWQEFNITVNGYEVLNADQISERWNNADTSAIKNYDIIIATIQVTYHGEENQVRFPLTSIRGQSGAWYNSSDLASLLLFNEGSTTCKKGETRNLYTAIGISQIQFCSEDWEKHNERSYDLVFQTYPDIIKVKLNY